MRRALVLSLVIASSAWTVSAQRPAGKSRVIPPEYVVKLNDTLAEYMAGDDHAVERLLRTRDGLASLAALEYVFGRPKDWSRESIAFLAEVAVGAAASNPARIQAVQIGRGLAIFRTAFPGADPADDRFEVLWHQIALGVLQDRRAYRNQYEYLESVDDRYVEAIKRSADIETRFALARAVAVGGMCCPPRTDAIVIISSPGNRTVEQPSFETAIALFDRAAAQPALKAEALIRGGALQLHLGHPEDALAWLDRVPGGGDDRLLHYVQFLTRGRALDLLNRPEESAVAYGTARADYPTAQIPAIGQAAALFRQGKTDEAVSVATEAKRLPAGVLDPWNTYMQVDARFLTRWLDEIRTLRK